MIQLIKYLLTRSLNQRNPNKIIVIPKIILKNPIQGINKTHQIKRVKRISLNIRIHNKATKIVNQSIKVLF